MTTTSAPPPPASEEPASHPAPDVKPVPPAAASPPAAPAAGQATRPCSGCSESVLATANKCRLCGAWLAVAPAAARDDEPRRACPGCGESILALANKCRFCGAWLDVAMGKAHRAERLAAAPAIPIDGPSRVGGVLAMLALVPLGLCSFGHVCMCGHLAHGVGAFAIATDATWSLALLGAAVAYLVATPRRTVRALFAAGTVLAHLVLAALAPLDLIAPVVLAVMGAADTIRALRQAEDSAPDAGA